MGTPIEPPPDAGDPCNLCWGVGKSFGNTRVPAYMVAHFEGIQVCDRNCVDDGLPPIPEVPSPLELLLKQDPLHPCYWLSYPPDPGFGWHSHIRFDSPPGNQTWLWLGRQRQDYDCNDVLTSFFDYLFSCSLEPACQTWFGSNDFTCVAHQGYGGTGWVTWYGKS